MADEHSLNADLARILQKAGIQAEPQIRFTYNKGKRRVVDIVCREVQGYTIGIEAKMRLGQQSKRQQKTSIAQAEEIIEKSFCDAAIALIYPDGYKNQNHLESGKVKVAVRTPLSSGKKNPPEWNNCPVQSLPGIIKGIPSQLSKSEELSKRAETAIHQAYKKIEKDKNSIMDKLRSGDLDELAQVTDFRGLLVDLLACFMFHHKLDQTIPDQPEFR